MRLPKWGLLILFLPLYLTGCGLGNTHQTSPIPSPTAQKEIPRSPTFSPVPARTSTALPSSPLPIPTSIPPSLPTLMPTPTFLPTLAPEQALVYFYHLLDPVTCTLPCIFGIVPGKTSLPEARQIWAPLGNFGFEGQTTTLGEGQLQRSIEVNGTEEMHIYVRYFNTLLPSSIVQEVIVSGGTDFKNREIWQHWQHFSITGVGKYWGTPAQVYLSLDFQWEGIFIALAYNGDINRVLLYGGDITPIDQKNARICVDSAHFSLDAWPATYGSKTATQDLEENWADPALTKTSSEALGLNPQDFIEYVQKHQTAEGIVCFTTPISIWPPPYKPEP